MTLVTDPGDPAADSYTSLDEANAYFTARGDVNWTDSIPADAVKEVALRRGTTYLENQYRDRWVGIRTGQFQSLAWPRVDGLRGYYRGYTQLLLDLDGWYVPDDVIPQQIKNATAEAALLSLTGTTLEPVLVRGNMIKSTTSKVDVIEKTIVYMDGAPAVDRYTVIEGLLRGFVTSFPGASSGNVRMVRS
jgi:hypothetical protein